MKKNILLILLATFLIFIVQFPSQVKAETTNEIDIYVFTKEGCSKCKELKEFLSDLEDDYIIHYYAKEDEENKDLLNGMKEIFDAEGTSFGYPFTIIGGKHFIGFSNSIRSSMLNYISFFTDDSYKDKFPYYDIVKMYQNNEEIKDEYLIDDVYEIPLLGKIDAQKTNLVLLSVVLGFLDGINPCGMWVLLFILSLLIPTNDKKKIWALGGTFILISGILYLILMMAWINFVDLFRSNILLMITGIFALAFGGFNIYKYIQSKIKKEEGCDVTSANQKRKLSKRIKGFIQKDNLWIAILGIAGITIIVNLIEVACSAGWPAIYSNILVANRLTQGERFMYTLIYVLFFLIDDIIVFLIAVFSLKIKAFSNILTKYSHLIGGILMIIFGILMVFFPEFVLLYL